MQRRALLATLGATALGGCASLSFDDGTTERTTTDETTTDRTTTDDGTDGEPGSGDGVADEEVPSPPEDPGWSSIVDLETISRTYALSPTRVSTPGRGRVQFAFADTATAEHPATLRVWLTNSNPYEQTFDLDVIPGLGNPRSRIPEPYGHERNRRSTYRQSLVLSPTDANELVDESPSVERDADGHWRAAGSGTSPPEFVTLEPEETVFAEYYVVGHQDGVGDGRPTGIYEFRGWYDTSIQIGVWDTDSPGPDGTSRFVGVDVPSLGESATAWYHDADEDTAAYLEPSTERGTLPEQVGFTVVNRSRSELQCGHWNIYKLVDGEWFHVAPYMHTSDCRMLAPGAAKSYTLNAYHGEALGGGGFSELGSNVGWLGAGRYAVVVGYGTDADESGALVELTGNERTVVPTEDASATRDGATVRVETPRHDADEYRTPATVVLERSSEEAADGDEDTADSADDATGKHRRFIPEQVMRERYRALRNTLAYAESGVEAVRLQTNERSAENVTGYDGQTTTFRFDGETYRVSWEADEE